MNFKQGINWIVRLHCEIPFMPCLHFETPIIELLKRYVQNGAKIASVSERTANDLRAIDNSSLYLPTCYHLDVIKSERVENKFYDDVACFGAIHPLKNQLLQAVASLKFSKDRGKKLRFHINNRVTVDGSDTMRNLKALFANRSDAELILHDWLPKQELLNLLSTMTIGMQVSLTEASNITSLDYVNAGLPIVTSHEVKWPEFTCGCSSVSEIVSAMHIAVNDKTLLEKNISNIRNYNIKCLSVWERLLQTDDRVLFVGKNYGAHHSIVDASENDSTLLNNNGFTSKVVYIKQDSDLEVVLDNFKPTFVVLEDTWAEPSKIIDNGENIFEAIKV